MLYKIHHLSWNVAIYEELHSTETTIPSLLPFLQERMAFLETIRKQPFKCHVLCLPSSTENNFRFDNDSRAGIITIQYPLHADIRYSVRLLSHELCHMTAYNGNPALIPNSKRYLSTYEEIIAETFAMSSLLALVRKCHQVYGKDHEELVAHYIEELKDEVRTHMELMNQAGLRAVPLYDDSFLPEYENIRAIAFLLLPHFEYRPELWRILPYVQDIHPLADWNEFFGHLIKSADEECRKALIDLYKNLFA